jgi:hypothetical protein
MLPTLWHSSASQHHQSNQFSVHRLHLQQLFGKNLNGSPMPLDQSAGLCPQPFKKGAMILVADRAQTPRHDAIFSGHPEGIRIVVLTVMSFWV